MGTWLRSAGLSVGQSAPLNVGVFVIGDSISHGAFLNPSAPAGSYPGQLQSRTGFNITRISNLGTDGYTTAQMLSDEVPAVLALLNPNIDNIVLVLGGTNDGIFSVPAATTISNLTAIVSALHTAGAKVVVGTITPSNYSGNPGGYQTFRTTVNAAILAGSTGADDVFDCGNDTRLADLTAAPYSTFPSTFYQTDLLHFKAAGLGIIEENATAALQRIVKSMFAYSPVDLVGVRLVGSFPRPANTKVSAWMDVNDFGASYLASADINTQALNAAVAAARATGRSLRFTDPYYNIHKINLCAYGVSVPLRLWSDTGYNLAGGPACLLICDGAGASWLKAAVNVAPPNAGNTAAVLNNSQFGIELEGIYVQQTSGLGVGSLHGFWGVTCFNGGFKNCGAVKPPGSGAWAAGFTLWQCGEGFTLDNPWADTCATGIAPNGSSADTSLTAYSETIQILNPKMQNCTAAGISGAFTNHMKIYGGYALNCAVGFYDNGAENSWTDGYFGAGNTKDWDMLVATAPWGPTVTPNGSKAINCSFGSVVNFTNSTGPVLSHNTFRSGSSLTMASSVIAPLINQHNSLPTTFTISAVAPCLLSCQVSAGAPTGLPGIASQLYYDSTGAQMYICTVSSSTSATWAAIAGTPSTLAPTYRATTGSPVSILTTDFCVSTNASSGACTVNLPAANAKPKLIVVITNYNSGAGLSNITRAGSDTIQKILTSVPLSQYATIILQSDGVSNWIILGLSISLANGTGILITQNGTTFTISNNGVLSLTATQGVELVGAGTGNVTLRADSTQWANYSPGSLTLTGGITSTPSQTFNLARFKQIGKQNFWRVKATFTAPGSGSNVSINVPVPSSVKDADQPVLASVFDNSAGAFVPIIGAIYDSTLGTGSAAVANLVSGRSYTIWIGSPYEGA